MDEWTEVRERLLSEAADERTKLDAQRDELLTRLDAERKEWTKERTQLLNRIQRPETAVYENFEPTQLKQFADFDSDTSFWDAKGALSGDQ